MQAHTDYSSGEIAWCAVAQSPYSPLHNLSVAGFNFCSCQIVTLRTHIWHNFIVPSIQMFIERILILHAPLIYPRGKRVPQMPGGGVAP
jgi:hypothetical protein